ncbi:hypothetical protein V9T40_012324 [Parthenolecanium corni]|uniref:Reelin domain-containing protein n=1 Tax=Parthenolecanium corni TaxID=536013 RepID=A0AAN9TAV7_9HEMI
MNALFSITSLLMVSGIALAYKSGAPVGVCDSMIPEHGVDPKDTPSPYTISVDKTNIKPGGSVTLKITGTKGHKFKGFFVQARNSTNHIVNGTFGKVAGAKVIDCPPGNKNAVTHINPDEKTTISLPWTAPQGYNGPFHFLTTVVKDGEVFWVHQKSPTVKVQ